MRQWRRILLLLLLMSKLEMKGVRMLQRSDLFPTKHLFSLGLRMGVVRTDRCRHGAGQPRPTLTDRCTALRMELLTPVLCTIFRGNFLMGGRIVDIFLDPNNNQYWVSQLIYCITKDFTDLTLVSTSESLGISRSGTQMFGARNMFMFIFSSSRLLIIFLPQFRAALAELP